MYKLCVCVVCRLSYIRLLIDIDMVFGKRKNMWPADAFHNIAI